MIDELETLRAWVPMEEERDEGAARARARLRLDAHIAAAPAAVPVRVRPRRRWWLVAAPGALGAAVGAAILISLGSGVQEGQVAPAPASAAAALERAAVAATRGPAPEPFPRPDQFFYTRTQATYLDTAYPGGGITVPSLDTRTREAWISLGRNGGERTIATKQRFPSPAARAAWVKAGRFDLGQSDGKSMTSLGKTAYYLGNERLSYVQLLAFNQSGREPMSACAPITSRARAAASTLRSSPRSATRCASRPRRRACARRCIARSRRSPASAISVASVTVSAGRRSGSNAPITAHDGSCSSIPTRRRCWRSAWSRWTCRRISSASSRRGRSRPTRSTSDARSSTASVNAPEAARRRSAPARRCRATAGHGRRRSATGAARRRGGSRRGCGPGPA